MQKVENRYSVEQCQNLFKQVMQGFWNLNGTERLVEKTNTFLFDLVSLYSSGSDELKMEMQEQFVKACLVTSYVKSGEVAKPLSVMIPAYHTMRRCAKYTPLYNILQNMISETAISLQDWYDVANNEEPLPGLKKEIIAETIPGALKNMALQMILLKGKTLDDMGYVKRNCRPGSPLYVSANNASVKMLSASNWLESEWKL